MPQLTDVCRLPLLPSGCLLAAPPAGSQVRFILMNSFSTSEDTKDYLRKSHAGEKASQSMTWHLLLGCWPALLPSCTPRTRLTCPALPYHPHFADHTSCLPPADLLDEPDVELLQNMSCKVDAATLKPADYPENPEMEW